ncbi:MAG: hypothetical protein EOO38_28715, partial [Cytophagaceae bacterium]
MADNKVSGAGGTTVSFSNAPQAKDDVFSWTEDNAVFAGSSTTIISLDVMANDLGGNAKSLFSLDDGTSAMTATKNGAPLDLTSQDVLTGGVSAWEASGTDGIRIRLNGSTGKVEVDLSGYLNAKGWSSLQSMGATDSITESFTYAIKLGNGTLSWATANLNIAGSNDAAILSSDIRQLTETNEAADVSTSGKLTITDVDSSATFQTQTDTAGKYGRFSVDATGAWTYVASSAHNEFVQGQTYTEVFTVKAADGTATTVTVNIAGTNDTPVAVADTKYKLLDANGNVPNADA